MNGKKAKQLRKQAGYKKIKETEIVGDYNIQIGSGKSFTILNVPKTQLRELSVIEQEKKKLYSTLKKEYKSV